MARNNVVQAFLDNEEYATVLFEMNQQGLKNESQAVAYIIKRYKRDPEERSININAALRSKQKDIDTLVQNNKILKNAIKLMAKNKDNCVSDPKKLEEK